jgi:acetolactate synthase-1/2/3 large subunit
MVKVCDVIVKFLEKNNIKFVFGIIGSANSYIYNSLANHPTIKLVPVHHEQAAVMAMGAYYRATGKMEAVALVTAGAGSSNAFTGILSNWADSIPGIIISGQEQSYYIDDYKDMRMIGIQGYDSIDTYKKHTKLSQRVNKDNVYDVFSNAFKITQEGRPGPVFLEVPFDVQSQLVDEVSIKPYILDNKKITNVNEIDYIINCINSSKKPVILGGHGIKLSNSESLFQKFVDITNIPTLLTWSAIDILPTDCPNNFGRPGVQGQRSANFIIQNSDLLIVFGSRLSLLQTGYSRKDFAPHAHIIHIDIDESEIKKFNGKNINSDVKVILRELLDNSNSISVNIEEWKQYCINIKSKYPTVMEEHLKDPTNSYTFIDWFSKKLPDNYTIVTDMGTALLSGFYGFNIKPNQKMFTSLGLGEMGYGLAAAVGAGFGDKPVMCLNCDGGMMLNLQELQTIKTHNLPVKIIIFNNDGYLMIKHTQNMLFGGVKTCVNKKTGVELPDYQKIADAFGYEYYTIDRTDEFISSKNQAILEIFMTPEQEFIPKVKGIKNKDNSIEPGLLEEMSPLLPLNKIEEAMISGLHERSTKIVR